MKNNQTSLRAGNKSSNFNDEFADTKVPMGTKMVDSRCGLHCTGCGWKDSHGCGGCIETQGHPFHGECPVAVCCQNKGIKHCGECENLPELCGEENCKTRSHDGCLACNKPTCGLLYAYSYGDFEHGDNGARINQCKQWALVEILKKFAESGWDLIAVPSKAFLENGDENTKLKLQQAIELADQQCGSCGCELDALYKRALKLLK